MFKKKKETSTMDKLTTAAKAAITLYAVKDVATQKEFKRGNKFIWTPIVTFGSFVGPAAYFLFGKGKKK